jgi:tetratricopeptide (TPR) repeat protein
MDIYKAQGQSGLYLKVLRNQIENGKNYDYSVLWDGANRSFQIRDYDMVVFFSKQCNEKSPNRHSIYNLMGVAYYYLKQYRLSVIALKTAVAFMPKEPIYNANLGRSYEMLGEYAKAAEYYEVSLKYDPDFRRSALSLKRVKALLSNQKSE